MNKILRAIGMILLLIVIYTAVTTIVTLIIGFGYALSNIGPMLDAGGSVDYLTMVETLTNDLVSGVTAQMPLILLLSIAVTLPIYYLIYRKRKQELRVFCSLRPIGLLNIPVLILFALAINFILELVLSLLQELSFFKALFESYGQVAEAITGGEFFISLISIGIIAPIFEELLFRGLIFGELRKVSKIPLALVIQALIFGVYHMNVIQSSYAFLLGLLLGFVYYRSSSIIAPVIMHITINSSSLIMSEFMTDAQYEQWGLPIVIASFIIFILIGIYILMSRGFRRAMDNGLFYANREAPQTMNGHMPSGQMPGGPMQYGAPQFGQNLPQPPYSESPFEQPPNTHIPSAGDPESEINEER